MLTFNWKPHSFKDCPVDASPNVAPLYLTSYPKGRGWGWERWLHKRHQPNTADMFAVFFSSHWGRIVEQTFAAQRKEIKLIDTIFYIFVSLRESGLFGEVSFWYLLVANLPFFFEFEQKYDGVGWEIFNNGYWETLKKIRKVFLFYRFDVGVWGCKSIYRWD